MAAKNGRTDLRNTADNLDETGPVADATPVEEWRAFACTSVRALFEAAAKCEAGDHGTVQAAHQRPRQRSARVERSARLEQLCLWPFIWAAVLPRATRSTPILHTLGARPATRRRQTTHMRATVRRRRAPRWVPASLPTRPSVERAVQMAMY